MNFIAFRCAAQQQARFTLKSTFSRFASTKPPAVPGRLSPVRSAQKTTPSTVQDAQTYRKLKIAKEILESHGDNVLLYKAPKRTTTFRVQNWVAAGTCAAAVIYYHSAGMLDEDRVRLQGLPWWLGLMYKVIVFFIGGVGTIAALRNYRLIHTIKLVQKSGTPVMQLTTRRVMPFLKKVEEVEIGQLHYGRHIILGSTRDPIFSPVAEELHQTGVIRSITAGVSHFFYRFFMSAQQFFSPASIVKLSVHRTSTGGTVKEDGGYRLDLAGETPTASKTRMPYVLELSTQDEHTSSWLGIFR